MLLLNDQPIDYFSFSGGELQVKLPDLSMLPERVILTWKPTKPDHIFLLALTVNALREAGILDIDLDILYLPYARQDRVCAPGEAYSLKVICKFLDDLDVSAIRLWDVHNTALTLDLLPNNFVWEWEAHDIFDRYKILNRFDLCDTLLCAPDRGAYHRVDQIVKHFGLLSPVYLEKDRNAQTGQITNLYFPAHNRSVNTYDIIVVDDICDGGATFLMAADVLKSQGANDLYLYITHGIFSKGLDELSKHYKHIYCHHVLDDDKFRDDNRLTILRSFPYVP